MAKISPSVLLWAAFAAILLLGIPREGLRGVLESDAVDRSPTALAQRLDELEAENTALRSAAQRVEDLETEIAALRAQLTSVKASASSPSLDSYPVPEHVEFCGESIPLDDPDVFLRFEDEWYRFLVNRHWLISWMRRARDTFPPVEAKLAAAGLPDDLKYVMVIESASNPRATSSAGAVGYWQFIQSTGKRYGLRHTSVVDERRSLDRSTDAAIAYLTELREEFGSWALALSAYNAGEKRVRREVEEQGSQDFYGMILPRETEAYWFKAAVAKVLFAAPERYGFVLSDHGWARVPCDTLTLRVQQNQLPFKDIAASTGLTYRQLLELNPQYRTSSLPRGEHQLVLPRHVVADLEQSLARISVVARSSSDADASGSSARTSAPGP
jgi:membrane-bound lytic murein transglycosylase D